MLNADTSELLDHASKEIELICNQIATGKVSKVSIKNTLENLRSALDYSAQDIAKKLKTITKSKQPDKVYFPYGERENHFKLSIKKNLPDLQNHLPRIHSIIQGMQPFICQDPWLVDLCKLTNDAKHNSLTKTQDNKSNIIYQGGVPIIEISGASNISMTGTRVNGVLQDDIYIDNTGVITTKKVTGDTLILENNRITFHGKEIEVKEFLKKCHCNLSIFMEKLEQEMG